MWCLGGWLVAMVGVDAARAGGLQTRGGPVNFSCARSLCRTFAAVAYRRRAGRLLGWPGWRHDGSSRHERLRIQIVSDSGTPAVQS